ncbi:MAG: hypothetical protein QNJ62_13500 [Methyloceanibacter sp.]|nr:hypothetical protein [Methyloceanibacter sp.]
MQSFALKTIAAVAAMGLMTGVNAALAQDDAFELSVPKPETEEAMPTDLECGTEMLSGSGPGFTDDRDQAENVAIERWMEKAAKVFPDTELDFDLAKDSNLSCAVQGLYSKCFADGIPCKPKG